MWAPGYGAKCTASAIRGRDRALRHRVVTPPDQFEQIDGNLHAVAPDVVREILAPQPVSVGQDGRAVQELLGRVEYVVPDVHGDNQLVAGAQIRNHLVQVG